MVINIEEDIANELQERVNALKYRFKWNGAVKDCEELANILLRKWANRVKHAEAVGGSNKTIAWGTFRVVHFNEIYMRDKGRCQYCTERVSRKEATLDHRIPVKRNGINNLQNVCIACRWCNEDKGMLTDEEYQYKQLHNAARGIKPVRDN